MPGVQTIVPVMLTHVAEGRLTLARFIDLTSAGPHRVFGIAGKGRIAQGYDADFTVVDLRRAAPSATMVGLALRLDAVRRHGSQGLARRHVRARSDGDVRRPARHAGDGAPVRFLETMLPD